MLIFVLLLLLSVFVIYVIGFRLRHLITLSYPSFVICVVVGVIFYAVFQLLADSAHWWVGLIVCALFTCLRVVGIVWEKLHPNTDGNLDSPCTKRSETGNKEQPDAVKDDASWQWLDEEKPISSREQDRFGIFQKAELIAKRFGNQPEACIGIVGPFGAGKTSLINLVRNELDPRFLVVPVSCWGFENASKAEEHILSQIIIGLNEKVDCLGIRHLPQHYLRSVMSGLSWFGAALHTFLSPKSPRDRLKQLSPILRASNIHLILALEDIDRTDRNFSRAQIPALMRWLGEAHHVSLILSANEFTPFTERDRKETSPFDMHRLCEYSISGCPITICGGISWINFTTIVSRFRKATFQAG